MDLEKIRSFRESIRIFEREIALHLKEGHRCCGVTLAQCHVLIEIGVRENGCLFEISKHLGLDKSTLSRTVDNLVRHGLVKRENKTDDRRYIVLSLTEKGKESFNQIDSYCDTYYSDVFQFVPLEKEKQVLEGIRALADGFEKYRKLKRGSIERQNIVKE